MSYRECANPWGSNFASPVDRLLGTAFLTVREVALNLGVINQISQNLTMISAVAANLPSPSSLPTTKPGTPGLYWNNNGVLCIS